MVISRGQAEDLTASDPVGSLALRVLQGWFRGDASRERFEFYDPLAVALALDPGIATMRRIGLDVVTEPGERWGESVVLDGPGTVSLAAEVDETRFFALLEQLLGWKGL